MFELGLKCCFTNMMKWLFKVVPVEQTLQGRLRTHSTASYHPGSGARKQGQREMEGERRRRRGEAEKPKCKTVVAAGMSAKKREEKLEMKECRGLKEKKKERKKQAQNS